MNFAQMLSSTPPIQSKKKTQRKNTSEEMEKWKTSMRSKRNTRWKEAFMAYGNKATAQQLAGQMGISEMGTTSQIIRMRKETPPCIEKIGEIDNGNNGKNQYVYRWIGD